MMKCDKRLSRKIRQLEGEPAATALRDKLMADAVTAAASARTQTSSPPHRQLSAQGVWKMRRVCLAAVFALAMVAVGLWFFPRQNGSAALADVSRAMARTKSVHITGWKLRASGQKERMEIWAEKSGKFRFEDGDTERIIDDGQKLVSLSTYNGEVSATIRRTKDFPMLEEGMSYLRLFSAEEMVEWLRRDSDPGVAGSRSAVLPDGRRVTVIEMRSGPLKTLLTVDAETSLVLKLEGYGDDGTLFAQLDRFEYDLEIPDSVFNTSPPRNAVVLDQRLPVSEKRKKSREAMEDKLREAGGANICKISDGGCGSPYHHRLRFRCLSRDGMSVYYFKNSNSYHVLGKALIYDQSSGWRRTVEDGEVQAPYASDYVPTPRPRALTPQEMKADAMLEKAKTPGAKAVYKGVRGAGSCGSYHNGLRFHMLRDVPVLIEYLPRTNTYRITGKVEVWYPNGRTEIIENADIKAPGPPDRE